MRAAWIMIWLACTAGAQTANPLLRGTQLPAAADPKTPPARHVHDDCDRLSFDVPAGWNYSRRDGELSTFALDARSAVERSRMHGVANLDFNPFPYSTFSGGIFYVSSTAPATAAACSAQAVAPVGRPVLTPAIDGVIFRHGYGEHGGACIESRDEVYTTLRGASCLRFDLVINTFCGGTSGVRDMTAQELDAVRHRLEAILASVHFDGKAAGAPAAGSAAGIPPRAR